MGKAALTGGEEMRGSRRGGNPMGPGGQYCG